MSIFILYPVGRGVDYPHSRGITQRTKRVIRVLLRAKQKKTQ